MCKDLATVSAAWQRISTTGLGAINTVLAGKKPKAVVVPKEDVKMPVCG